MNKKIRNRLLILLTIIALVLTGVGLYQLFYGTPWNEWQSRQEIRR